MTIEDEGMEPDFEVEEKPKKKKTKKAVKVEEPVPQPSEEPEPPVKKTKKGKKRSIEPVKEESSVEEEKPPKTKKKKQKKEEPKEEDEEEEETSKEPVVKAVQKTKKEAKKEQRAKRDEDNTKLAPILKKLKDEPIAAKVREILAMEVAEGRLDAVDSQLALQKWRKTRKHDASKGRLERLLQMGGKLEDVKKVADELVRKRLLHPAQAKVAIHKCQNREKRRVGRKDERLANKFCFNCRQSGHLMPDCPQENANTGICFKCGSGEHSVHKCPRKHVKGFPFATCFVCGQQGHLSRDCEKNEKGIYPDGGSCNVCGSQKHLKRDCPELAAQKQNKEEKKIVAHAMTSETRPDEDYEDAPVETKEKKKKSKVVKF